MSTSLTAPAEMAWLCGREGLDDWGVPTEPSKLRLAEDKYGRSFFCELAVVSTILLARLVVTSHQRRRAEPVSARPMRCLALPNRVDATAPHDRVRPLLHGCVNCLLCF